MAPELLKARRAFSRSHVYSAYLLNVAKARCGRGLEAVEVQREGLNFKPEAEEIAVIGTELRQELFIWEVGHGLEVIVQNGSK